MSQLSSSLLLVGLFDREVNVRRAAAAAIQEHVGRQGADSFVNGIKIITTADYFSLALRDHAFIHVAPKVALLSPLYALDFIDHLASATISHWDASVRTSASLALYALTFTRPECPHYVLKHVVPRLVSDVSSVDSCTQHGALLSLAILLLSYTDEHAANELSFRINDSSSTSLSSASSSSSSSSSLSANAAAANASAATVPLSVAPSFGLSDLPPFLLQSSTQSSSVATPSSSAPSSSLPKRVTSSQPTPLPHTLLADIFSLPMKLSSSDAFADVNGNYLRIAVCRLVTSLTALPNGMFLHPLYSVIHHMLLVMYALSLYPSSIWSPFASLRHVNI